MYLRNRRIMKIKFIINLVFCFLLTVSPILAQTQSELNEEITKLEKLNSKKVGEIKGTQLDLDATIKEIEKLRGVESKLSTQISDNENNINEMSSEIIRLEEEKKELEIEAEKLSNENGDVLVSLQQLNHEDFMLNTLFKSGDIKDVYHSMFLLKSLSDTIMLNFSDLLGIVDQITKTSEDLELQKTNLEVAQIDLEKSKAEVTNNKNIQEAYSQKLQEQIVAAEQENQNINSQIASAQADAAFLKSQGCVGNDVYGVDCGPVPKPPEPNNPSGGGGGGIVEVSGFVNPVKSGVVTAEFGWYAPFGQTMMHYGLDVANSQGTPIYAAASGQVIHSGWDNNGGGNQVRLIHNVDGKNFITNYAHLSSVMMH